MSKRLKQLSTMPLLQASPCELFKHKFTRVSHSSWLMVINSFVVILEIAGEKRRTVRTAYASHEKLRIMDRRWNRRHTLEDKRPAADIPVTRARRRLLTAIGSQLYQSGKTWFCLFSTILTLYVLKVTYQLKRKQFILPNVNASRQYNPLKNPIRST